MTTPATQALLPVTQSDRDAAADYVASFKIDPSAPSKSVQNTRDGKANSALVQAFARHRQAHSLPGDALREAATAALKCLEISVQSFPDVERKLRAALTPSALSGDAGEVA